jgi:hypothetical protein
MRPKNEDTKYIVRGKPNISTNNAIINPVYIPCVLQPTLFLNGIKRRNAANRTTLTRTMSHLPIKRSTANNKDIIVSLFFITNILQKDLDFYPFQGWCKRLPILFYSIALI